jgi:hypothetical protein
LIYIKDAGFGFAMLETSLEEVQMTSGEVAYLSMSIAGFVIFALVLFAIERIEKRRLGRLSQFRRPQMSGSNEAAGHHA